jgi:tetratricopeptide (TPR) repeat protein
LHGADDLHLIPALHALAHLELQREHGAVARGYLDRSLAIQRRIYGEDHPEVARTFELIAGAEYSIAHYDEAVVLYQRARAIYDRSVAPDSLSVANVLSNLGNVYMWQGKPKEAIALDRRAIAIATARLGASHPLTLSYQTTLAQALDTDDQQPEARALLEHVLAEQRVQLGTHQATAMTLEALANLELGLHRYAAARDHALEANAMFRQVLGEGYQSHAELRTLGDAYLGLGEPARAADVLEEARRHLEPSVDPGTIAWLDSLLGRALIEAGRDRVRGKTLVLSAWSHVVQDDRMLEERATLRAWMARHGITPP